MNLTMGTFPVHRVESARVTAWEKGVLFVNCDELRNLILKDDVFDDVSIEIAYPGEKTRIIHVIDAVEPRIKVEGPSCCFPGFLGPARTVGRGNTHRLGGMAVLGVVLGIEVPSGVETGVLEFNEGFIDMSGPAENYCACAGTINVCLCFSLRRNCSVVETDSSIRMATLNAANYLAKCTAELKPEDQVLYQLPPVDPDLPRIAYVNQIQSQGFLCRTFLYGSPMEGDFTPTLLHPNELFDGAVVSGNYRNSLKACTFLQQNNHVALELLKRHGKELNFVGMVIGRGHFDDFQTKERQGQYAAKLASLLGAQAAVLTIEGGGNANVDYMETVRGLELCGIDAVPIVHEWGGAKGDEQALIYVVPEAVSIVSGGGIDRLIEVPRMNRVVGGERMKLTDSSAGMDVVDASSSFLTNSYNFYCSFWQMQISGIAARDY